MKNTKILWALGGVALTVASIYAARQFQAWLAWREEREFERTERQIEQYEDYVHANGHKRRRWWWGRQSTPTR